MEGGRFLIERSTVEMPEAPDGISIIGAGNEPETLRQYYFDSLGLHRIYEMTLSDGVWKLWRDDPDPFPQCFSGTFSDDGNTTRNHSGIGNRPPITRVRNEPRQNT